MPEEPYIVTFSGTKVHPLDPSPDEIDIVDIAHALSHACRFNGHVQHFYSVAQHSVLVSEHFTDPMLALWGLLHDASEAYLSDIPSPLKRAWPTYRMYEDRMMQVIAKRFGLSWPMPDVLHDIDKRIVVDEAISLFKDHPRWTYNSPRLNIWIRPVTSATARAMFLRTYHAIRVSAAPAVA